MRQCKSTEAIRLDAKRQAEPAALWIVWAASGDCRNNPNHGETE
jgi:hypothetical protein